MRPFFAIVLVSLFVAAMAAWERYSTPKSAASRFTSLNEAVASFNTQAATHSIGKHQPPLTVEEVLAAIERWESLNTAPALREVASGLASIAATGVLPANAELTTLTRWGPHRRYHLGVWWIRLRITGKGHKMHIIPIRQSFLHEFGEAPPADIAWGSPAENGLAATCYLVPGRTEYAAGSTLAVRVALRNFDPEIIEFQMPSLHNDLRCSARDADGNAVVYDALAADADSPRVQIRLAPGQPQVLYHAPSLEISQVTCAADAERVAVHCEPGQRCRLAWEVDVEIRGFGATTLRTGDLRFAVVEPSADTPVVSVVGASGLIPDDELVGELVSAHPSRIDPGVLVAVFHTVRGSTSAFKVEVPTGAATEKERALGNLIRNALSASAVRDMPIIRIRTDKDGRPDPETWEHETWE